MSVCDSCYDRRTEEGDEDDEEPGDGSDERRNNQREREKRVLSVFHPSSLLLRSSPSLPQEAKGTRTTSKKGNIIPGGKGMQKVMKRDESSSR